jgi:hypothetical protein
MLRTRYNQTCADSAGADVAQNRVSAVAGAGRTLQPRF